MTNIDWVRATFIGAILGGLVWPVIIALASVDFLDLGGRARMAVVASAVNGILLAVSWVLWRSADERGRTRAAALWIVPFLGVAALGAAFTVGIGFSAVRGS